jgi:hypothetical protein
MRFGFAFNFGVAPALLFFYHSQKYMVQDNNNFHKNLKRILSQTNSGPGPSSTNRTTSKFKNNEELLQNSASVSATKSMSTSTSLAPPLVFEHNHVEKTATVQIAESPPLPSLNYREHEPIVRNNGKPRRLLHFNDNGLSTRTVAIKTFKQPKEATQVQISQVPTF